MTRVVHVFNALIRTHHITSRKKLQRVKRASENHNMGYLLIRFSGSPGLMYAEGQDEASVSDWVSAVQGLRYKDFRCVCRPAPAQVPEGRSVGVRETTAMAGFGREMEDRGLRTWWKKAMGYTADD